MIIKTENNTRFNLLKDRMVERGNDTQRWYLQRENLKKSLASYSYSVPCGLATVNPFQVSLYGDNSFSLEQGVGYTNVSDRKKFLRIGCMVFLGKERVKLIRWARSYAR
jgi:hypothetical protein